MKQLVKRAMLRDEEAFVELMRQSSQSMYKVAKGFFQNDEDVADVIQNTILICFEKIETLQEAAYFKTWLIRILINQCNDLLREQKKQCLTKEFLDVVDSHIETEAVEFRELLNALEEKYRMILILYYVEGFSIKEISGLLHLNVSTVKTRLARGRNYLRQEYLIHSDEAKGGETYAQEL